MVNRLPCPDGAAHQHAAAVGLHNMFHNGQTNSDALGFAAQFRAAPVKSLENLPVLLRRNAGALVFHPKADCRLGAPSSRPDLSTWRRGANV
jgi:hypothetical protein